MKKLSLAIVFFFTVVSFAQVGINTTNPEAQLDIKSSNQALPSNKDGLLIPKIDTFPATNPTAAQQGMLVYLTTTVGTTVAGFYYWNNPTTTWLPIKGIDGGTLDQAYDFGGAGLGKTITADAGAVLIDGTDGLVSTGTLNSGAIAPSGAGTKMFWNPRKAAFRAGQVNFTQWDDVNIGTHSFAFGESTEAIGEYSAAFGFFTIASGDNATAFGGANLASGDLSTAFGNGTIAGGNRSTAFGQSTTSSGFASTAFGNQNTASSFGETVLGIGATIYSQSTNGATQFRLANATDRLFVIGNAIDANNNDFSDAAERSDAIIVLKNGLTRLPSTTNTMITAADGKAVVTKEYLQSTTSGTLDQAYDFSGAGLGKTITADAGAVLIDGTDGFVSTGTFGSGVIAPSGAGVKMFWNPRKAAFRAGKVFGTQWDDVNIGDYSTAFGTETRASGSISTAFGIGTSASGVISTAFGISTIASGTYSTAFGATTTASGDNSVAFGLATVASGPNSTAFGSGVDATGVYSTAFGFGTTASGVHSTAFGASTIASGKASTAFGDSTIASGQASTAFGMQSNALSFAEIVLGIGATNYTPSTNGATLFRTANATDRLFVIGNAIDANNNNNVDNAERSNALIVLKNGLTRLPSTTNAMITAADGKAVVTKEYLEQNGSWGVTGNTGTNATNNFIGTTDSQSLAFRTNNTEKMTVLTTGEIGIGTSSPQTKLDIVDANKITTSTTRGNLNIMSNNPQNIDVGGSISLGGYYNDAANTFRVFGTVEGRKSNAGTASSSGYLSFKANNSGTLTERMRITNVGDVGIGTTTPERKLHVSIGDSGGISNTNAAVVVESTANVYQHFLSPSTAESGILFGNELGTIGSGIIFNNPVDLNGLLFRTGGNFTRMTLTAAGDVGIGTPTPGGQFELSLNEGRKPGTTTWTIVSDQRLKTINGNYTKGLNEILQLNPIRFNYKNVGERKFEQKVLDTEFEGFIAQELQPLFPDAVGTDADGFLNFNIHPILIASVNAFKELNVKYEELKTKNEELENKLNALLSRIEKLENK